MEEQRRESCGSVEEKGEGGVMMMVEEVMEMLVVVFGKALGEGKDVWRSGNRCGRERCGNAEEKGMEG